MTTKADMFLMIKALIISLFISTAFAETFTMKGDKDVELALGQFKGISTARCETNCQAIKIFNNPKKISLADKAVLGNPASRFCKLQGGKSIVLRDKKNRQYDFCQFDDGSMIDSWGLYEKH